MVTAEEPRRRGPGHQRPTRTGRDEGHRPTSGKPERQGRRRTIMRNIRRATVRHAMPAHSIAGRRSAGEGPGSGSAIPRRAERSTASACQHASTLDEFHRHHARKQRACRREQPLHREGWPEEGARYERSHRHAAGQQIQGNSVETNPIDRQARRIPLDTRPRSRMKMIDGSAMFARSMARKAAASILRPRPTVHDGRAESAAG